MNNHAWCRSPSRDEAVRAAEDNRTGPLPTLEEAIAVFSPSEEGLRTERVTLEIVRGDGLHVRQWPWHDILKAWGLGEEDEAESVRVVEEADRLEVRLSGLQAAVEAATEDGDTAIRRAEAAECRLSRCLKARDSMWSRILVTCAERDTAKQNHLRECAKCAALADKVLSLKARVAELEAAPAAPGWLAEVRAAIAAPQPAKGWLTAEEREALAWWCGSAQPVDIDQLNAWCAAIRNLLARVTPPEVVRPGKPLTFRCGDDAMGNRDGQWIASLDAAGIKVKEVGE